MQPEQQTRPTSRSSEAVAELRSRMLGSVLEPRDAGYEEARKLYNAMIDKRPRFIARCRDVADVVEAVRYGRSNALLTAVRGGGHSGAGFGSCEGGLVIDLSRMDGVRVDLSAQTVRVEGGATWGAVDHATHEFGLATPSGIISTTGVGGLTLLGGHGYLTRKYGLTIDNLLSADVVLADGSLVTASERNHSDLFWALRGGGGNFGVVTSFEFRLHPVSQVFGGPVFWAFENAPSVLAWYDRFMSTAPRDIYGFFSMHTVPPAPPFPEALHHQKVCGVVWCCLGEPKAAVEALRATHEPAEPVLEAVGELPYPALQRAFDGLYPPGLQWYWRGQIVRELSEPLAALNLEFAEQLPTELSCTHFYPIDGAVHDVPSDATAFPHRDARWSQVIVGVDSEASGKDAVTRWTRAYSDAIRPYTGEGAYLNFLMDEGSGQVQASHGSNFERLAEIKRAYDPDNFFRVNQNVPPAQAAL